MFIRILKTIVFGTAAYYATRRLAAHAKLLRVRAEAQLEMDRLDAEMRQIFDRQGQYAALSAEENFRLFDTYLVESKRWTKIHAKTF